MTRDDVRTSITLPPELYEAISKLSKNNGRSMNSEITKAISQYITQSPQNQTSPDTLFATDINTDVIKLLALLDNSEVKEKIRIIVNGQN